MSTPHRCQTPQFVLHSWHCRTDEAGGQARRNQRCWMVQGKLGHLEMADRAERVHLAARLPNSQAALLPGCWAGTAASLSSGAGPRLFRASSTTAACAAHTVHQA
jgi:hypothetical protein